MNVLGFDIPLSVDISGFLGSSWIYIFFIFIIFAIILVAVMVLIFYKAYNKKVIFFENISGEGFVPVKKTRARTIKLKTSGGEVLKTFAGGIYLSADGKKMGKNTYWFVKGQDGYWYNSTLGDFDAKRGMLDIEPVDRDVKMFYVAIDRLSQATYGQKGFLEKYGVHILLFFFLIALVGGMWVIIGKVGDATQALASTAKTNADAAKTNQQVMAQIPQLLEALDNIRLGVPVNNSGIVPVNNFGG